MNSPVSCCDHMRLAMKYKGGFRGNPIFVHTAPMKGERKPGAPNGLVRGWLSSKVWKKTAGVSFSEQIASIRHDSYYRYTNRSSSVFGCFELRYAAHRIVFLFSKSRSPRWQLPAASFPPNNFLPEIKSACLTRRERGDGGGSWAEWGQLWASALCTMSLGVSIWQLELSVNTSLNWAWGSPLCASWPTSSKIYKW